MTSIGGTPLGYDLNGNLLNDGTHIYTHDAVNRLVDVDGTITYTYDALGRRVSKTVNGTVTKYVYDGARVIAEYDGAGQLLRKYIYGPGLDEPMLMQTGATRYYYLFDSLGSVIGLTDASGSLVESYRYSVYGQPLQASTVGNPYLFTGRRFDSETGLYYYRNRYYSPQLRRFIEPDPIGFEGGMNLYAYVGNDPGNATDPWGLYRSLEILRYIVPGQILFDHGMTALENGNYGRAAAYFAGMLGEQVLFALSFGQSFAASGTAVCNVGSATSGAEFVFSGMTKAEARLASQLMGLPNKQAAAVSSAISRATSTSTVQVTQYGPDVIVQIYRPGANGYQVIESIVTPSGTKSVLQKAYDALGNLVHIHRK